MKLKGRRQSKNVEKQSSEDLKGVKQDNKFMRDLISQSNERLRDKTPIANIEPNLNERMNTINPGFVQEVSGGYKINNRTLKESYPPQHIKVREIEIKDNFQETPDKGPIPKKKPKK